MLIADALSCAVAEGHHSCADDLSDERVVYALEASQALSEDMLKQLTDSTARDSTLQLLVKIKNFLKKTRSLNSTVLAC